MIIQSSHIDAALAKANEVADYYKLHFITGNDPMRAMDYVLQSANQIGLGPIRILELDEEKHAVVSMCVMHNDGSSDIVLAKGLNHCWKRYSICKEIFHILIDQEQYRNLDIFAHTEMVSVGVALDDSNVQPGVAAEYLAEFAAMEFLFPYANREAIIKSIKEPDYLAIATQYRIPQLLVDKYLSKLRMEPLAAFSRRM